MEETLTLRLANRDDVDAILAVYAPYVTETAVSFELEVPSREAFRQRLSTHPCVVCTLDGRVVGFAGATAERPQPAYRWNAEVSVYLELSCCRQGIGTEMYRALFELLAMQGYRNLYAVVALPNPASLALHLNLGFSAAGLHLRTGYKLGRWRDVQWLHKAVVETEDVEEAPPQPVGIQSLDPASVARVLSDATGRLRRAWAVRGPGTGSSD